MPGELLRHHLPRARGTSPGPLGGLAGLWAAEQLPGVTEGIPALKKQMQGLKLEFCHAVLELTPECTGRAPPAHWLYWGELGAAQQAAGPFLLPRWRMSVPPFCLCHDGFGDPKGQTICPCTREAVQHRDTPKVWTNSSTPAPGSPQPGDPRDSVPPSFEQFPKQTDTHSQGVSIIHHWMNPEHTHQAKGCAGQPEAAQSKCSASPELI